MSTLRQLRSGAELTAHRPELWVQPPAGGEVAVRVIGGFAASRAGLSLPPNEVGSRKARNLLALLAADAGYLAVDDIAAALWGETPPKDPAANIATLVSRLRATFGPDVIFGYAGGYRLGEGVRVDLADAAALVAEAESLITGEQPLPALMAARRAIHLLDLDGVLPEQPDARWAEPARARHAVLLGRARLALAESALRAGDVRTARAAADAASAADPFDETACRLLMRAHHAAAEPARALLAYHRLRTVLATELGVDPALATRKLHITILGTTARAADCCVATELQSRPA